MSKLYEIDFKLQAGLAASFGGTFEKAQKKLAETQKEIQALGRVQSNISAYQKQEAAIERCRQSQEKYKTQIENVKKELQALIEREGENAAGTSALSNKIIDLKEKYERVRLEEERHRETLQKLDDSLKEAGINTENLSNESRRLGEDIKNLHSEQDKTAQKLEEYKSKSISSFAAAGEALAASGIVDGLQRIWEEYKECAQAAIKFESTMTGVAKTTDFTDAEFVQISREIKQLSLEIPSTTEELGMIAETAGQLGIAKEDLIEFTETMAMLGTSTNMASEEAATLLAQFASITGMDSSEYQNLGSTVVALGNSFATTEKNVTEMSQTIAAAGAIAGMHEAEIAAISAAVTSLGITAQNGGTQMTKLISDINSAVSSGEGLSEWAAVAGMSARDFADAWRDDAASALDTFIVGLNRAYENGEDVYSLLANLGISETRMVTMMTSLAKSGDRLTETLSVARNAWKQNNALTSEAEKRYATTASNLAFLNNAYENLHVTIGKTGLPLLNALAEIGTDILVGIDEFAQANPGLVSGVTTATGVFGIAAAGLTAYTAIAKTATAVTKTLSAATASIGGLGTFLTGAGVVAVTLGGIAAATANAKDKSEELTAVSEKQRKELEALEAEYRNICDQYGVTSYQAQELSWQLETLSKEYEASKQTISEYNAEFNAVMEEYKAMAQERDETIEQVDKECDSIMSLINRLNELSASTNITASEKEEILAIIERLNSEIPGLSLSYDQLAHSMSLTSDEIIRLAEIEINKRKYDTYNEKLIEAISKKTELEEAYATAIREQQLAYDNAVEKYQAYSNKRRGGYSYSTAKKLGELNAAIYETMDAEGEYAKKIREAEQAIKDNNAAIDEYSSQMAELTGTTIGLEKIASDIIAQGESMKAIYDEAYAAAYESITGQFALWDNAAEVVPKSIADINNALATQGAYWSDYRKDLAELEERGKDIEGLAEVIASFADGSADSVNTVAGLVQGTDEELRAFVETYRWATEEEMAAAGSLVDATTLELLEIENQMNSTIENLDLKEEAALAGKSTIEAYVEALREGSEEAAEYLNALADILGDKMSYNSAGTTFNYGIGEIYSKYATGTRNACSGWALVGEEGPELVDFSGGEAVYNAFETERMLRGINDTYSLLASVPAVPLQASGGNRYEISISPTFYITSEDNTPERLEEYSGIVADMVLDRLNEIGIDAKRGAFK